MREMEERTWSEHDCLGSDCWMSVMMMKEETVW